MKEATDVMRKHSTEMEQDFNKRSNEKDKIIKNLTNERDAAVEQVSILKKDYEGAAKECEELAS